ncbi:ABC transporter permease [Peptostreptococcus porci]|uniref:ABC transporter permease n=1 Tax=Peptostreptococcus porci TaxID=2652282 RepID=UPI0023EFD3E6|nr:ABC transporter permease [Peptostreptococcus porci]MDD7184016.1 ABC transporter permease [Peptostreptococcus porci]MDY5965126.1 ABC transporter permease [Peptostreptococcus porci]
MRKRVILIFSILLVLLMMAMMVLFNRINNLFSKEFYIGIVTVEGDAKPEISFMDKSLNNIGKIKLDAKAFLTVFNYNKVEQDKNAFYFVKDSSVFSKTDELLKVNKKDFRQSDIKMNCYPSYFFVGKNNIYTIEILVGKANLNIYDKEKNTSIVDEKINHTLSPSMFEYNSDLYYYMNDKNKVTLYNHTKKKSELTLEGINEVLYTHLDGDTIYVLGKFIEDDEKGQIGKYDLIEYNLKTKAISKTIIKNDSYRYMFSDLILFNNNIILQEDITMVLFKNKKEIVYLDRASKQTKNIIVDEYPQSISVDNENNLILVSKNSIYIYDKDFKLIKHKKIDIIEKDDYGRRFNSYIVIGGK